ncbi:hypothetical protein [Marinobacter shengliensis]
MGTLDLSRIKGDWHAILPIITKPSANSLRRNQQREDASAYLSTYTSHWNSPESFNSPLPGLTPLRLSVSALQ